MGAAVPQFVFSCASRLWNPPLPPIQSPPVVSWGGTTIRIFMCKQVGTARYPLSNPLPWISTIRNFLCTQVMESPRCHLSNPAPMGLPWVWGWLYHNLYFSVQAGCGTPRYPLSNPVPVSLPSRGAVPQFVFFCASRLWNPRYRGSHVGLEGVVPQFIFSSASRLWNPLPTPAGNVVSGGCRSKSSRRNSRRNTSPIFCLQKNRMRKHPQENAAVWKKHVGTENRRFRSFKVFWGFLPTKEVSKVSK